MNIKRKLTKDIKYSIKKIPVTAIIGARQVGKTTLARSILKKHTSTTYLDLEKQSDLKKLDEIEVFLEMNKNTDLICIDEIQLKPNFFSALRSFVDENQKARFLILGSSTPKLLQQSSQTLAGRIFYHKLSPFNYLEINKIKTLNEYHLQGGFPKSILHKEKFAFNWLENFITTFLENDMLMFNVNFPSKTIHRLWIMLAHLNAQILKYAMLSNSMGIDAKTVKSYIAVLEHTFMIRILQPYHINIKKRLIKSPKIYIRDTGILHTLLNIKSYVNLYNNPYFAASWESLIIENVIERFNKFDAYFYRTADGAEIDLVLIKGLQVIAVEIKSSLVPKLKKGFWTAIKDIKATKSYIIAPVREIYPYKNNVMVYPLKEFLKLNLK